MMRYENWSKLDKLRYLTGGAAYLINALIFVTLTFKGMIEYSKYGFYDDLVSAIVMLVVSLFVCTMYMVYDSWFFQTMNRKRRRRLESE